MHSYLNKVILSSSVTTKLATTGNSVFLAVLSAFEGIKGNRVLHENLANIRFMYKKEIAPEGHEFPKNALQFAEVFRL